MSLVLTKDGIVPRALVGTALVSSFVWFYWFQKNPVGYSSETKNGVTHVVAGSSPFVLSLSILGIIFFIFLMSRAGLQRSERVLSPNAAPHRRFRHFSLAYCFWA